ncbi:unnamed protein product [Urochloa decumbens]|uniref:PGG domain-containing protein n=1 Tax=Urochloa decumbens TaxID=240449 RepID=A0ABC9F0B6_9POAL
MAASEKSGKHKPWEYTLRKYLLLMATVAAALTYAAAFSPPGGVWQDTGAGHLAGDPIIRDTHYRRYLAFFYCNATAFASSLVVIVLILLLSALHESHKEGIWRRTLLPLRAVMVLDLLSLMGAYAAGTCRDAVTTVYSSLLVAAVFAYLVVQTALASSSSAPEINPTASAGDGDMVGERARKVLMLLATFAISVTYVSGLSTPGGFWDGTQPGRRAGDAILEDYNRARLVGFFVGNTTAFVASLVVVLLLLDKKLRFTASVRSAELYGCIVVALVGLVVAYAAGSCRDAETTAYVVVLVALVLGSMVFQLGLTLPVACAGRVLASIRNGWRRLVGIYASASEWLPCLRAQARERHADNDREEVVNESMEKARSLVLLLGTLATSVTYQAGLDPPGGVWQDDGDGHMAGDPILLTTNPRRYKAFYYCNSTAFMASLAAIVLVQKRSALKHHTLEAAMILDLLGLVGAYAAGSCRDVGTSLYVVALAAAVVVYVAIHAAVFYAVKGSSTSGGGGDDDEVVVEKRRKRLLLFAILAATITYQAGLTPPSGFWPDDDDGELGHRAGEPVLLSNYPRRYRAFFYSNSLSFMSAIAHILLLVHPRLYRPAIRSYALSVCTAAGLLGLMAAYASGSTQHLKTSIYVFVLAFLVVVFLAALLVLGKKMVAGDEPAAAAEESGHSDPAGGADEEEESKKKKMHDKSKYLMLLGILMASVTYAAGLEPPGGVWQSDGQGHIAGDPVLRTNRRLRYLLFFHCNSTSFVASVVVVVLLLPRRLEQSGWWLAVTNVTVVVNLLGLLGAHAAGSSRGWETSGYAVALVVAALGFVAVHALMACCFAGRGGGATRRRLQPADGGVPPAQTRVGAEGRSVGEHQPLGASV